MRACLPNVISDLIFGSDKTLEVSLDASEAHFVLRRNGDVHELGRVSLDAPSNAGLEKSAVKFLKRNGGVAEHVTLRLPRGQVLRPTVDVPIAAAENLREVLAFEMNRHTPFSSDEVLFDFRVAGSDADLERLSIEMMVARRRDVEAALSLASIMRLSPDRVTGQLTGTTETDPFNLLPPAKRPSPGRLIPRLVVVMTVVTLALGGVTLGLWHQGKQQTLERFDARVAELRATTGETGKLEEKVARLLAVSGYLVEKKTNRPQMVEILDEVTRQLPDGHWLISFSARKGTVQLSGYSDDPSGVLRLLENSALFSEARFISPVTKDPRIGKDLFNMVVTVTQADGAQ
ncbi:MAG TPA: PilN domain-containing protein [Thermohalobaculum sp.]|nr:PilN domain-containing protein [Thermohalobaculum sp.]